jgi:hypothetical protein
MVRGYTLPGASYSRYVEQLEGQASEQLEELWVRAGILPTALLRMVSVHYEAGTLCRAASLSRDCRDFHVQWKCCNRGLGSSLQMGSWGLDVVVRRGLVGRRVLSVSTRRCFFCGRAFIIDSGIFIENVNFERSAASFGGTVRNQDDVGHVEHMWLGRYFKPFLFFAISLCIAYHTRSFRLRHDASPS